MPRFSKLSEGARDLLGIALASLLPVILLRPFQNAPYVDDWVYAWSVQWLLQHHELRILEFSASINVVQTLWGALFCLPFGFSFTALRVSTWVLSVLGLCGLYLTLRECEVSRRDALLGTAVLAFYPIYFILSITYMTDVPFLTMVIWCCYALTKALREDSGKWFAAASFFACCAVGIRVPGMVLPGVTLAALLFHGEGWRRKPVRYLSVLVPVLFGGLLLWWHQSSGVRTADLTYVNGAPANKLKMILESGWGVIPSIAIGNLTFLSGILSLALVPLLPNLTKKDLFRTGAILAVLVGALGFQLWDEQKYVPPLSPGQVWSAPELGATQSLVTGYQKFTVPALDHWTWTATVIILGALALARIVRMPRTRADVVMQWFIFGYFAVVTVLWLSYDRYGMVFVPAAIVLLLSTQPLRRPALAWALTAGLAALSLVGARDHLEYNRTLWTAVDSLRTRGATDAEIGGSYMVNGWLQFAHPENGTIHGRQGELKVPWVTTKARLRYEISNVAAPDNTVVQTFPYVQWIGHSGTLYVLEKR